MSIVEIKPNDCPSDLVERIRIVMRRENLTWEQAVLFLANRVVSPAMNH